MRLTPAQIKETVHPGDLIIVQYLDPNVVAVGIQLATGGRASHVLCCLGGLEIVEADIGGVMHTYLDNYLKGKCRLTVKRLYPELSHYEAAKVCDYWRGCISQPYDIGMILHVALASPVRRLILPIIPPLGRLLLRIISWLPIASNKLSTCAELGAIGLRQSRPKFLRNYDSNDITPEALLRDATSLRSVVVWDSPVIVGKP